MASSPFFVRQPQGNRAAKSATQTLKEQLLWVQYFAPVEHLRQALGHSATLYDATWPRAQHGHRTIDQVRPGQLGPEPEAATGLKLGG